MTALLELRQKISEVYGRYEAYVRICTKCLLAFLVFYMIHSQLSGSMNPRSWAEIVVATLIAVMIPIDACSILVAIFVIVHMLMISVEAGVTAAAFFLFLLLTYFIFKPRQSILITVMCLVGMLNLTGAAAIPIGLLCGPIAVIPAAAGTFVYGMILTLRQNSSVLEASAQRLTSMEKAAYFIKAIGSNERILLLMAALVVTIVVVYMIRKLPYSYAWAIAIAAGTACYVLTVLVGNVAFGVTVHLLYLSISIILGVLISSVLHVFLFLLDGTHTEFLEYEDENYVYYVRAIPKYSVARTDKKVTTITKAGDGETSEEDSFLDDDQSLDDYFRT